MSAAVDRSGRGRLRERIAERKAPAPLEKAEAMPILSGIFSGMSEAAERARARKEEAAEIRSEEHLRHVAEGPDTDLLKSDPAALAHAMKRHQIKKIAEVANPLSPDTDHVFTANGSRFAKTGVYVPTVRERAAGVRHAARKHSEAWWDKNKKTIVVGSIAVMGAFLLYSSWKNTQLERRLASGHGHAHRSGFAGGIPAGGPYAYPGLYYAEATDPYAFMTEEDI